jgi:hypothetical protein|tara:strand:+ start:258 stop:881 length:624 start_codon:yes stop_codon:yes gene_type:complete
MEKYNSENASYPQEDGVWYPNPDAPELVGKVEYPHIIFNNEDGKCGMKVSLEEIVDVWLETIEPERQRTLELEETTRSEKRELATLREEKERREEQKMRSQVRLELIIFLHDCILKVLENRGLKINKKNVRLIIDECRLNFDEWEGHCGYNPRGILFTQKEWDEFFASLNPYQHLMYEENANNSIPEKDYFSSYLKEMSARPISYWR